MPVKEDTSAVAPTGETCAVDDLLTDDRVTIWGLFLESHEAIRRALQAELDAADLGVPDVYLEVLIRLARTPGNAIPMTKLADMMLFSSGGFTKLADRMVAAGLIERQECATDRRSRYAALTERGKEVLAEAMAVHGPGIDRHLLDHLTAAERNQLEAILRKLRDAEAPAVLR